MSSKLQSEGCYYYTQHWHPLVNAMRWGQVWCVCR